MRFEGRLSSDAVALARWRSRGGLGKTTMSEHRAALRALGVMPAAENVERDRDECERIESLASYFHGVRLRRSS
jgi:hypothetical protein